MPKIEIYLQPGETELDAHNALCKALDVHNLGLTHNSASFEDPVLVAASKKMFAALEIEIYPDMFKEISAVIREAYK